MLCLLMFSSEERDESKKQLSAVMEESHKHRSVTVQCPWPLLIYLLYSLCALRQSRAYVLVDNSVIIKNNKG